MTTEGRCQCQASAATQAGHDPGTCRNALSEPKNVKCRPCALAWHLPVPCDRYRPEPVKHLVHTCADCGFDSARHPIPVGAF